MGMERHAVALDGPAERTPELRAAPAPRPGGARARTNPRTQFSLLIVRGDGARVLRLNFPRPLVTGAFVALAVCMPVLGVRVGHSVQRRQPTAGATASSRPVAD